jgi:DNA polymerase elongation subunit (family B)
MMIKAIVALPPEDRTPLLLGPLCKGQAENFDKFQLGVKVSMNSFYGVMMKVSGPLALPEIGATVTSFGRDLITLVKCLVERQTSENAKKHLGMPNHSNKPDNGLAEAYAKETEGKLIEVGEMLRKLPKDFVPLLNKWLQSNEAISAVYGDTYVILRVIY